jgi:hypothetical protein
VHGAVEQLVGAAAMFGFVSDRGDDEHLTAHLEG